MSFMNSRRSVAFQRPYNPVAGNDITRTNYLFDAGNDNSINAKDNSNQEPNELKDKNKSFFDSIPQNPFISPIKTNNGYNHSKDFLDDISDNHLFVASSQSSPLPMKDVEYNSEDLKNSWLLFSSQNPECISLKLDTLFEKYLSATPIPQILGEIPQILSDISYSPDKVLEFLDQLLRNRDMIKEDLLQISQKFNHTPPQILKDLKNELPSNQKAFLIQQLNGAYKLFLIKSYLKCLGAILEIKKRTSKVSLLISSFKDINKKANEIFQEVTFLPRNLFSLEEEKQKLTEEIQGENFENLYVSFQQLLSFSIRKIEKDNMATVQVPYQRGVIQTKSLDRIHSEIAKRIRDRDFCQEIEEIGQKIPVLQDKNNHKYSFIFSSLEDEKRKLRFKVIVRKLSGYPWTKFRLEDVKVIFGDEDEIKRLVLKAYNDLQPQRNSVSTFISMVSSLFDI